MAYVPPSAIEQMCTALDLSIRKLLDERAAIDNKLLVLREAWSQCEGFKKAEKKVAN